ncbi:MAG TPA: L,D-transpeptidase family protein, partial [Puia sp.]|nr:L,D-transpeptidase family protein [Puia sp.]
MSHSKNRLLVLLIAVACVFCGSCTNRKEKKDQQPAVAVPRERISEDLRWTMEKALKNENRLNDSVRLNFASLLDSLYSANQYEPFWSKETKWLPLADSLFGFISNSKEYGLFPRDYHYSSLAFVQRVFLADTLARKNLALWARTDILLTDAFFTLAKDLKQGRLRFDSVTLRTDSVLNNEFYKQIFQAAFQSGTMTGTLHQLEPRYPAYDSLKAYIKKFLGTAVFMPYTYLVYPYKDSIAFFKSVEKRLHEVGEISPGVNNLDSVAFTKVFRKYQKKQDLKVTGTLSDQMVDRLNYTDWEKFKKIAVNLDRYKQLPDTLPKTRAWINLPSYYLQVIDADSTVFQSRIIVGGRLTRTPLLTSEISNFITYPQWTVPYSIIFKEMLPKIQHSVDFLAKENLMVVDENDSVRDPTTINWAKLNK